VDNTELTQRLANLSPARRALLEKRLKEKGFDALVPQAIRRRATSEEVPVSFAQERLWFLNQLDPENPAYNDSRAFRLYGHLDVEALQQSLNRIVARHEVLRTTIVTVDGLPKQLIAPTRTVELPLVDLRELTHTNRDAEAHRLVIDTIKRPFDLSRNLMLRVLLLRLADQEHVLLSVKHHVASDGWSSGIFWQELSAFYQSIISGRPCLLPELPVQYADYAIWQREYLQGEVLNRQLFYWKKQLDNTPILELPLDRPRPATQTYRGSRQSLTFSQNVSDGLKALSRDQGATLFMTLLAGFKVLLHRYTAQDDIVVGSPIAGRTRQELEGLIGFFVNSLVLRTDLSGDPTFKELLGRVRKVAVGAYAHQDLPFEKLVEELQPERSAALSPFFQVVFAVRNDPRHTSKLTGLTMTPFEISGGTSKSDLYLSIMDDHDNLRARCEYKTDLFNAATIDRFLRHYQTLLEGVLANPDCRISDLPILTEPEKQQIFVNWNRTEQEYPKDRCVHQLFEEQAERFPDAIAVTTDKQNLSYGELNRRANQVAHLLKNLGVGAESIVGICMEHSLELLVGLMGILKAGAAYLPLDPLYPMRRLAFMMKDTDAKVLVTQKSFVSNFADYKNPVVCFDRDSADIARQSEVNPAANIDPQNLAYVIYTSGTTGVPKGVMVAHRSLVNYLTWFNQEVLRKDLKCLPALTNLAFDASLKQLFGPLLRGGSVWIVPKDARKDPTALVKAIRTCFKIGINCVPSLWTSLLEVIESNRDTIPDQSISALYLGGEQLDSDVIHRTFTAFPDIEIWNLYGPTEATANCLAGKVAYDRQITLGGPIANAKAYILDKHLNPLPVGIPGQLCVGGDGLARGYLNQTVLTNEKFVANPFSKLPGERLYKTGDLARYLPDGNVEFLRRIDDQVKIRGYRVELREIELALQEHPDVQVSVAVVREDTPGDRRLTAYVIPRGNLTPSPTELKIFVSHKLPGYMVPAAFVFLTTLPLTSNGKIDRGALAPPEQPSSLIAMGHHKQSTILERSLAEIWGEVLNLEKVGLEDNFFDLGGHSLLAVKLVAHTRQKLGIELRVIDLFESPTIKQLAAGIEDRRRHTSGHSGELSNFSHIVHLKIGTTDKRIFCIPYMGGFRDEFYHFLKLVRSMGPEYSFLGLRARGVDGVTEPDRDLSSIVAHHVHEIRKIQPRGPYFLLGECFGGKLAYEIAQKLQDEGQTIAMLAFLDSNAAPRPLVRFVKRRLGGSARFRRRGSGSWTWKYFKNRSIYHLSKMRKLRPRQRISYLIDNARQAKDMIPWSVRHDKFEPQQAAEANGSVIERRANKHLERGENAYWIAIARASHRRYKGAIVLITDAEKSDRETSLGWEKLATKGVQIYRIPGNHNTYITEHAHLVAVTLSECLEKA